MIMCDTRVEGVRMLIHTDLVESNLYNKTKFQLTRIYYDNVQDDEVQVTHSLYRLMPIRLSQ